MSKATRQEDITLKEDFISSGRAGRVRAFDDNFGDVGFEDLDLELGDDDVMDSIDLSRKAIGTQLVTVLFTSIESTVDYLPATYCQKYGKIV